MYQRTKRGCHIEGLTYQKSHIQDPVYLRHRKLKAQKATAMRQFLKRGTKMFEAAFNPRSNIMKRLSDVPKAYNAFKQADKFYF